MVGNKISSDITIIGLGNNKHVLSASQFINIIIIRKLST